MSNLYNIYLAGGAEFMHPISLLFMSNIVGIGYIVFCRIRKKLIHPNWLEIVKHFGGVAVAYGTFGTLLGLLLAFDALEKSDQIIPFQVIMGGLKVSLINILYGLIVFFFSMVAYIALKLTEHKDVKYEV